MSSANPLDEVLRGQPLAVDIATIEDQLRELWKETVVENDTEEDLTKLVTRMTVLNLIVFVEDMEQGKRVSEAIADLTVEHPCRAIVAIADAAAPDSKIEAWISAHCHRPSPSSKVVCCEQISLDASGGAVRELAPTVVPFLISDLPVFLWWYGSRLLGSDFLKGISGVCDRLILDSKQFASPREDFPRLEVYIQSRREHLAVSDLAWHRLMQWRELAAQFFDAPVFRAHLAHIENVVVEFNERAKDGSSVPPQAYLLVGWLASRLQWSLAEAEDRQEGQQFQMKAKDGRRVTVIVRPTETHAKLSGHLVSFAMATTEEWATTFRIAKGEFADCAETEIRFGNMPPYRRAVPLRIYNEVELIARQLEIFGHDPVYEQAIQMAARMVGALN